MTGDPMKGAHEAHQRAFDEWLIAVLRQDGRAVDAARERVHDTIDVMLDLMASNFAETRGNGGAGS